MARYVDTMYAAGFFDGEGSLGVRRVATQTGEYYYPQVQIAQKYPPVLELFMHRWGGSIFHSGPKQGTGNASDKVYEGSYTWCATTRVAREFLIDVQPFVLVKKEQVDFVLGLDHKSLTESERVELAAMKRRTPLWPAMSS